MQNLTPLQYLKQVFGFESFRGSQEAAISAVMSQQNCLVIMPTGSGKSLCFQIPSQILPGLTLVLSPLIALMKDQVDQARRKGLNATFINSSLSRSERVSAYKALAQGKIKLLYVTPERFQKQEFLQALLQNEISLLAIDEAHCISQWGHDFRPDYSRVGEFRKLIGGPPTIALTATATPDVQTDIVAQLNLKTEDVQFFINDIERPNLFFECHIVHALEEKIQRFIADRFANPGPAIVYFALVATLMKFSDQLEKLQIEHIVYHGQLPDHVRKRNQNLFLGGKIDLILATPAFGLGVDKPDIRFVAHAEVPGSVEAYYQEIGRAGRDSKRSKCVLYYDPDDLSIQMDFLKWANPDPGFIHRVFQLLGQRKDEIRQEGVDYLRGQLHFYHSRDFRLETCLNLFERWGVLDWQNKSLKSYQLKGEISAIQVSDESWNARMENLNRKLYEMMNYANLETCRKQFIYKYFGLSEAKECENCDVCQSKHETI